MLKHKKILALLAALAMLFVVIAGCGPTANDNGEELPPGIEPLNHPWVFVHGLNGYGDDTDSPIPYWGAASGCLLTELRGEGFEVFAPSVSAAGSARDRAAELFAQLTGTQVDYGIAHSERHGIERFGYEFDTPLLERWGEEDEYGRLHRVNLLGHSFGGATIRIMAALLRNGCAYERAAALQAGEEVSPLFAGGKGDWVFSLTAIAAPHNGVSLLSVLDVNPILAFAAGLIGQADIDQMLGSLGVNIPGVNNITQFLRAAESKNTAYADLSITGAEALNQLTELHESSYYFSFPVSGTNERGSPVAGEMSSPAEIAGRFIGGFTHAASGITDEWRENDGLVNTISATRPFCEEYVNVGDPAELDPAPGLWHVMPTVRGDHGSVIGLGRSLEEILPMYLEHMRLVDELG